MSLQEILSAAAKAGKKLDPAAVAFTLGFMAAKGTRQARARHFSALSYKLNDGRAHPAIGFGTYKCGVVPASATSATGVDIVPASQIIQDAVDVGYRMFDCAQFYANEADIGAALSATGVPRNELFLISKVWGDKIYEGPEAVRDQLRKTLADLRTDYVDLCVAFCRSGAVPPPQWSGAGLDCMFLFLGMNKCARLRAYVCACVRACVLAC